MNRQPHAHQPRIQRRVRPPMLVRIVEAPDRAADDIKAAVVVFCLWMLIVIAASLQGPALQPLPARPHATPAPTAFHMGPVQP